MSGDDAGRRDDGTNQAQQQPSFWYINSGPSVRSSTIVHMSPTRFVNRLGIHPTIGLSSTVMLDGVSERTPLFSRPSTGGESDDY